MPADNTIGTKISILIFHPHQVILKAIYNVFRTSGQNYIISSFYQYDYRAQVHTLVIHHFTDIFEPAYIFL